MAEPIIQNMQSWLTARKISNIPEIVMVKFQRSRFLISVHRSRGVIPTALYVIHYFFILMHEAPRAGQPGVSPPDLVVRGGGVACGGDLRVSRVTKVPKTQFTDPKVVGFIDKEKPTS